MRIVSGQLKGRRLCGPTSDTIRPTSDRNRESLFNILENSYRLDFSDLRVLDLFAGTGALGFEALSRGASSVVFVEHDATARALIRQNIENLSLEGVTRILRRDATDLGHIGRMMPFNLIFADPPYHQELGEKACVSALEGGWLANNALIVLEESAAVSPLLPTAFQRLDERHWGQTKLHFYKRRGI